MSREALRDNTAPNNSAFGFQSMRNNTAGQDNSAVDTDAGNAITTGDNNIDINNGGVAGDSNTTRIGSTQNRAFIAGIRGTTTDSADAIPVLIDSAGQLGTVSSSRRYKEDIHGMRSASDPVMRLRPVTFHYRSGSADRGVIAEQAAKVMPSIVAYGDDGRPETFSTRTSRC